MTTLERLYRKYQWFLRALLYAGSYAAWILVFRILVLSLITYFLMGSNPKFQDISDTFSSNEVSLMGLSALLFLAVMAWLNPLGSTPLRAIFAPQRLEKNFVQGFTQGAVVASGVILAFLLSGLHRYLGFYINFEEAPLALTNVAVRAVAVVLLAYCEEYFFREKLLGLMRGHARPAVIATITAFLYCGIKLLQFDLGVMHLITLFLISVALSMRRTIEGEFARGAGYWAAVLVVFHPLLSLPIFGNDFSGALLVKYVTGEGGPLVDTNSIATRLLSGGAGGPISSFAFQALLILDIVRGFLRNKKILLNPAALPLK